MGRAEKALRGPALPRRSHRQLLLAGCLVFPLREGPAFSTGRPITSKDLKYGIERSFASDVVVGGPTYVLDLLDDPENPYAGPYQDESDDKLGLSSIATPDDKTITFTLTNTGTFNFICEVHPTEMKGTLQV